jgi:hypothetical protein
MADDLISKFLKDEAYRLIRDKFDLLKQQLPNLKKMDDVDKYVYFKYFDNTLDTQSDVTTDEAQKFGNERLKALKQICFDIWKNHIKAVDKSYTPGTTKEVNKTTKEVNKTTKEVNKHHKDDGIKRCQEALHQAKKQVLSNNLGDALSELTSIEKAYEKELEGFPGLKLQLEQLRRECTADVSVHKMYRSFCMAEDSSST